MKALWIIVILALGSKLKKWTAANVGQAKRSLEKRSLEDIQEYANSVFGITDVEEDDAGILHINIDDE